MRLATFTPTECPGIQSCPAVRCKVVRPQTFFLQAVMRSGTNLILNALQKHPEICVFGEFLYPSADEEWLTHFGWYRFLQERLKTEPRALLPHFQVQIFREFLSAIQRRADSRPLVLDLKLEQVDDGVGALRSEIYNSQNAFIILLRRNLLKVVVSEALMYKRIAQGDEIVHRDYAPESMTISLDPDETVAAVERKADLIERYGGIASKSGARLLSIFYEDMIEDNGRSALEAIQRFADLPLRYLKSDLVKQNPHSLERILSNYTSIERAMCQAGFGYMMHLPS